MDPQPIIHFPLNDAENEIRLVKIQPLHSDTDLVRCTLDTISLDDICDRYRSYLDSLDSLELTERQKTTGWSQLFRSPNGAELPNFDGSQLLVPTPDTCQYRFTWGDYAALSYVWGSETSRRDIILNGVQTTVTKNLEIALRTLARKAIFSGEYRIWIDALCINQKDAAERASQVSKMREIYSGAWSVIAWLGEAEDDSSKAFHLLRSLAALSGRDLDHLANVLEDNPDYFGRGCFFGLHELMSREYWDRLWIVQEVVMGASATTLCCGDDILDWTTFCAGIAALYRGRNWTVKDRLLMRELRIQHISREPRWHTKPIHLVHKDLRQLSRFEDEGGDRIKLRRLLEISGSSQCRDTRDKVYALSGMMDSQIAKEVIGSYQLDTPRLFAAVARAFINHYNNLEPLRQGNPWGPQKGATWAADWTWTGRIRWSRPETTMTGPLYHPLDPDAPPETIYSAHGGRPARYSFSDDGLQLECDGFILDEIAGLGATEQGYFAYRKDAEVRCSAWLSAYGDDQATAAALYSALMTGRIANGDRVERRHAVALSNLPSTFRVAKSQFLDRGWTWLADQGGYYFRWRLWREAHDDFMLGKRTIGSYFTDTIPEDADQTTYIEVYCSSERTDKERRFMLTKKGFLGWAPDNAYDPEDAHQVMVGDLIAIIFGCSTPVVIRRNGQRFEVLGEAYVEGFMDGEVVQLVESGEAQVRTFIFQ